MPYDESFVLHDLPEKVGRSLYAVARGGAKDLPSLPDNARVSGVVLLISHTRQPEKPPANTSGRTGRNRQKLGGGFVVMLQELNVGLDSDKGDPCGQLTLFHPRVDGPVFVGLTVSRFLPLMAVVERYLKATTGALSKKGLGAVTLCGEAIADKVGELAEARGLSSKVNEMTPKEVGDSFRLINLDIKAKHLPLLIVGTPKHGFCLDADPSDVYFVPAPELPPGLQD